MTKAAEALRIIDYRKSKGTLTRSAGILPA